MGREEAWAQLMAAPFGYRQCPGTARRRGMAIVLGWLAEQPGGRWQDRWVAAGAGGVWPPLAAAAIGVESARREGKPASGSAAVAPGLLS